MRKRTHSPSAQQLSLFSPDLELVPQALAPDPGQVNTILTKPDHEPEVALNTDAGAVPTVGAMEPTPEDLDILTSYRCEDLAHRGANDRARREWLRIWAETHNYKPLRFTSYYKKAYHHPITAFDKEQWEQFLEAGTSDIYYAFIAAYAPQPLHFYLEEAEAHGEQLCNIRWTGKD